MKGHDESDDQLAQPDEEEEERRQHLADILERAAAIPYSSATVTSNGLSMTARRPTGNGFLERERRVAQARLRRALLASSLGVPSQRRRRTNAAQYMPQVDQEPQNYEFELTLADLDRALNNTNDSQSRPNMTGTAGTAGNNPAYEPHNGHYSAPQLTTTSSLLLDTDDDDEEEYQRPMRASQANFNGAQGQEESMLGDRARLRTMLLRGLAVPSTSQDIGTGHSTAINSTGNYEHYQQHHPPPPHHVDNTISLRPAIQRAHQDLVELDEEFRRMCEAARSRSVDEDGNELQFDVEEAEEEEKPSHEQNQELLARIVLPSSISAVAGQVSSFSSSSFSSHEERQRPDAEGEKQQEDRSKTRANADVAGTAILPLARKDTKRAHAA